MISQAGDGLEQVGDTHASSRFKVLRAGLQALGTGLRKGWNSLCINFGFFLLSIPVAMILTVSTYALAEASEEASLKRSEKPVLGSLVAENSTAQTIFWLTCVIIFFYFRYYFKISAHKDSFFVGEWSRIITSFGAALLLWVAIVSVDALLLNNMLFTQKLKPLYFWVVVAFGLWWIAPTLRALRAKPAPDVIPSGKETLALDAVIRDLRQRARRLKATAAVNIGMIIVTLLLGFIVFSSAGRRAAIESDPVQLIKRERLSRIELQREALFESHDQELRYLENRIATTSPDEYQARLDSLNKRFESRLKYLDQQVSALTAPVANGEDADNIRYLTNYLGSKLGSVVILIFLVQILVSLYRYNTRLAAFYEARADLLQVVPEGSSVGLREGLEVFSTQMLSFGKEPATPLREIADMAVSALSRGKEEITKSKP